jgi:hypothetical protein
MVEGALTVELEGASAGGGIVRSAQIRTSIINCGMDRLGAYITTFETHAVKKLKREGKDFLPTELVCEVDKRQDNRQDLDLISEEKCPFSRALGGVCRRTEAQLHIRILHRPSTLQATRIPHPSEEEIISALRHCITGSKIHCTFNQKEN